MIRVTIVRVMMRNHSKGCWAAKFETMYVHQCTSTNIQHQMPLSCFIAQGVAALPKAWNTRETMEKDGKGWKTRAFPCAIPEKV